MRANVSFILSVFFKLLKEADLGFSVRENGLITFNDRNTGEELYIRKEDFIKAYEEA